MKTTLSVVVVYEDTATRERAIQYCDTLVEKFWSQCGFEVSWCSAEALREEEEAREAAGKAAEANLVVFALHPSGELPLTIVQWVEGWLPRRGDHEGLLVGLLDQGSSIAGIETDRHAYLRDIAHRAGMDYLTEIPHTIHHPMPDSLEAYAQRADQVTSVLDTILTKPPTRLFR
jgi:hypothetical protein